MVAGIRKEINVKQSFFAAAVRPWLYMGILIQALFLTVSHAAADLPDFVNLVKDNSAAVVNINTTEKVSGLGHREMPFPNMPGDNDSLNEFFKRFFGQRPPGLPSDETRHFLGSGFIISPDGYILTNAHVVKDAAQINVSLHDHRQTAAKVIGIDERSDVALLKIDGHDLPTVKIGDSDKVKVGQWVVAIGSPFGLDYTATHGIISAVGRTLSDNVYVPFIQTDAAINPGNSGGPLFNTAGEVIGINSQIYSNNGGSMGLSFAVPINVAMKVADELKAHGHVTYAWLGVLIQPVSAGLAKSFGLDSAHGALVAQVVADSPAAKAGLQAGDIILSYDGRNISHSAKLPAMVGNTKVGATVPLTVWRNGRTVTLQATIVAMGKEKAPAKIEASQADVLGIQVTNLTAAQREKYGVAKYGVLVKEVVDGPAEDAGIQKGDVLLRIDQQKVIDTEALSRIEAKLPRDKPVAVLIQRDGSPRFLALTVTK